MLGCGLSFRFLNTFDTDRKWPAICWRFGMRFMAVQLLYFDARFAEIDICSQWPLLLRIFNGSLANRQLTYLKNEATGVNSKPALLQILRWPQSGDKPISKPMTHICVTWPDVLRVAQLSSENRPMFIFGLATFIANKRHIEIGIDVYESGAVWN